MSRKGCATGLRSQGPCSFSQRRLQLSCLNGTRFGSEEWRVCADKCKPKCEGQVKIHQGKKIQILVDWEEVGKEVVVGQIELLFGVADIGMAGKRSYTCTQRCHTPIETGIRRYSAASNQDSERLSVKGTSYAPQHESAQRLVCG